MSIKELENNGISFLNLDKLNKKKRQIVIVGSARGGTSLVAGALHHLGLFTGEKSHSPIFEDLLLSNAIEQGDLSLAKNIVKRYSAEHDVWAWKRPGALNYMKEVEKVIPNPFYIFIFKDIFSIANRNNISMLTDISQGLKRALDDYTKLVNFIANSNKPMMLVSAEKALLNKAQFVNALVDMNKDLVNLSKNVSKAVNFITPNPKSYLDVTRITKAKGRVGLCNKNVIQGWAFFIHDKKRPVEVELYVDGILHKSTVAKDYRDAFLKNGRHPTGLCGYRFEVDDYMRQNVKMIEVIAKGDIAPLDNGEINFQEVMGE